jgi:hypothetical protein
MNEDYRSLIDTRGVDDEAQESVVIPKQPQSWPEGYVDSFAGIPEDFVRPPQGEVEKRSG